MTFIRRLYLIFILLPVAITYAIITMLWVLLTHLFEISILKPKNK
jgi:uncharacterized membrane protein